MPVRPALTRLLVLASLLVPLGLAAPGAADATTAHRADHTRVISDCRTARYEPTRVLIACGDANEYATIRSYSSWTRHQARATGHLVVNTCTPDCAHGHFRSYPATFGFHRVVTNHEGTRVFSRLGVTYVRHGEQHNTTIDLVTDPIG